MFNVKVKIGLSSIHGFGLYAAESIRLGQKIYTPNDNLDLYLTNDEFSDLFENEQQTIKHYGFFDKKKQMWHLSFDDIRFCNHNSNGNMTLAGEVLVAKRDIKIGEELTQDYSE